MQIVLSKEYGVGFFTEQPQSKTADSDLIAAVLAEDQNAFDIAWWMLNLEEYYGWRKVTDFYVKDIGDSLVHVESYMGYEYVVESGEEHGC